MATFFNALKITLALLTIGLCQTASSSCGGPYADIGDETWNLFPDHSLSGPWSDKITDNRRINPSGDLTKRYIAPSGQECSVDINRHNPGFSVEPEYYILSIEHEDGICDDSFAVYMEKPSSKQRLEVGRYKARSDTLGVVQEEFRTHIPISMAEIGPTSTKFKIVFKNTAKDSCGRAAIYSLCLIPAAYNDVEIIMPPEDSTQNQPPDTPTALNQISLDGRIISVGAQIDDNSVAFRAQARTNNGEKLTLQVELRRLDEYGGQFDSSKGGLKNSDPVESGMQATAYAYGLINGYYHWRARVIDENGKKSDWIDFGNNQGADFIIFSETDEPPEKSLDFSLTVLDGDTNEGNLLAGVQVSGFDGSGKSFSKTTDSNGKIILKGSPGNWHFEASKSGYKTRSWDWELTASESRRYLLFKSQVPEDENIGFYYTFFDGSLDGPELEGVRIVGWDGANKRFDKTASNPGQVGFYLEGSPGMWHFEASKEGYQSKAWDLEIVRSEPRSAFLVKDSDIPPPSGETIYLHLTVHDGSINGRTLSGVRITGHDGAGNLFDLKTNSNGIAFLRGITGIWHFEASMDGYQTNEWDQELISSASRDAFLVKITEIPPPRSESIALYLTVHEESISGRTLSGVRVAGYDGAGNGFESTTDFNGIATLTGQPGIWHFEASKDGYETNEWDQELVSSASRHAFLFRKQNQDVPRIGCHEDPLTGQVICYDDPSVFSNNEPLPPREDVADYERYCINQGFYYQNGKCIFADGTSCDAVAFYRGECYHNPETENNPFESQPGCMRDPLTGQMICVDEFSGVPQMGPMPQTGPIPYGSFMGMDEPA